MKLSTQPYKGTRDYYPEDMRLRNWIFDTWKRTCESFGYEQYDGPILESLELFTAKTSEEIVNEQSYSFTDRGERKVIMRPEMTPTVSRMVAGRRQELGYPLRLYSIPNCFRYERPQKGRLREFWQLNADIFGVDGIEADVEIIHLADSIMKAFGAKPDSYEIRVNSRQLLNNRIKEAGVKTSASEVMRVIDRYDKQERSETLRQLKDNVQNAEELLSKLENDGPSDEVKKVVARLRELGVSSVEPTDTLARGFEYYTDIVFEVFDKDPDNNRSMFGGGRYDGLVGEFGVEPVPTVGFGMGDATLMNFLESNKLLPSVTPSTNLVIATVGDVGPDAEKLATELRGAGLNISVDSTDRKIEKKIKAAEKQGVRYVLFVGKDEIDNNKYNLKDIESGDQRGVSLGEVISNIK